MVSKAVSHKSVRIGSPGAAYSLAAPRGRVQSIGVRRLEFFRAKGLGFGG